MEAGTASPRLLVGVPKLVAREKFEKFQVDEVVPSARAPDVATKVAAVG